jgi:glycosyltransferase involved in cell wall biosynthesis
VPAPDRFSILHVSQPVDYGVAACVAALAGDQVERGWSVGVACPGEPQALASRVEAAGATHHLWPATRPPHRTLLQERRALAEAIDRQRPDVVHLHSAKAGLTGRLLLRGRLPTVFQPHAWSFDALGARARPAAAAWERAAARWVTTIVCCSEDEARHGRDAGIRARFEVVPNSVDVDRFRPMDAGDRAARRMAFGLGEGAVAVCVGRLSRQKGQDVLLAAWPEVVVEVPRATLALVGDGPERAALETMARELPGVRLVGPSDDVAGWLGAADLAVLPSRYEGMALGVLEAVASGCSVVAAAADGMAEVVGTDAGAIVPVEDVEALARAIVVRLRDPELRRREGAAGRRRAEERHDRRRWLDRLAAVAQAAASGAPS